MQIEATITTAWKAWLALFMGQYRTELLGFSGYAYGEECQNRDWDWSVQASSKQPSASCAKLEAPRGSGCRRCISI